MEADEKKPIILNGREYDPDEREIDLFLEAADEVLAEKKATAVPPTAPLPAR